MLQEYNMWKAAEHLLKTRLKCMDPREISAVNPDFYAQRFHDRLKEMVESA